MFPALTLKTPNKAYYSFTMHRLGIISFVVRNHLVKINKLPLHHIGLQNPFIPTALHFSNHHTKQMKNSLLIFCLGFLFPLIKTLFLSSASLLIIINIIITILLLLLLLLLFIYLLFRANLESPIGSHF